MNSSTLQPPPFFPSITARQVAKAAAFVALGLGAAASHGTGIRLEHRDKLFRPFFMTKPAGARAPVWNCRSAAIS